MITSRQTTEITEAAPAEPIWFRPAWRRDWFAFLLVLLGFLLLFEPQLFPGFEAFQRVLSHNDIGISLAFLVDIFGLLVVLMYGASILWNRYRWRYMIGPYGVESVRGLLGRDERRAEYANISFVRVKQGPIQRLFGVGDLLIGTSATSDPEVIFAGIAAPKQRKGMIQPRLRPASG